MQFCKEHFLFCGVQVCFLLHLFLYEFESFFIEERFFVIVRLKCFTKWRMKKKTSNSNFKCDEFLMLHFTWIFTDRGKCFYVERDSSILWNCLQYEEKLFSLIFINNKCSRNTFFFLFIFLICFFFFFSKFLANRRFRHCEFWLNLIICYVILHNMCVLLSFNWIQYLDSINFGCKIPAKGLLSIFTIDFMTFYRLLFDENPYIFH